VCTDGLCGIEEYSPTDISICGMGGELICKILEKADFVKKEGIRLILQPMTASSELYIWLLASGFRIVSESYAVEGSRSYRIMCAEYCGEPDAADICDAFAGTGEMTREHREYVVSKLATLERRIAGISITGKNVSMLENIRDKIKSIIE
jgi:tRNA (adenine22-N1)-methyltransferase